MAKDNAGSKNIAQIHAPPKAQVIGRPRSMRTISTTIKATAEADISDFPLSFL